jgi:hypothetical protein
MDSTAVWPWIVLVVTIVLVVVHSLNASANR